MDNQFWLDRWNRREIGWHLDEINSHLEEHWPGLGLDREALVFVPLCGKTLDLLWLAGQGHGVIGVEISQAGVDAFFAEHGLTPVVTETPPFRRYQVDQLTVLLGDFFDLTPEHLDGVDAVFDRASLIALPPGMRALYARQLQQLLPRPVNSLLITLDYDQERMSGPPFSVGHEEVRHLFEERYRIEELASIDALDDSPNFRRRGLTALTERVYWLKPRP